MRIPCTRCQHFDRTGAVCCPLTRSRPRSILDSGACRPLSLIVDFARRYLVARFPEARDRVDDVAGEVVLRLSGPVPRAGLPATYPGLRRWLFSVVANAAMDLLRKERIVARKRCGACAHFGPVPPTGCRRQTVRDPATGEPRPNPWHGGRVTAESVPHRLDPPCPAFFWRYRPGALEEMEAARARAEPAGPDERAVEIEEALAQLAARGPEGLRRALVLRRRYLDEAPTEVIAGEFSVTSRTIRREIDRGLADLRDLLGEAE